MTTTIGTARASGDRYSLDLERVYATTVEDVWDAVTQADRLARWMAPYRGDLRLGGRWEALNDDGTVFSWGTITECEAPHRYVTTWEYEGEETSVITVTVEEHPDGALLRLVHEGLADAGYAAGWQTYFEQLDETLPVGPSSVVDPDRPPGIAWDDRFAELREAWRPELARVRGTAGA